MSAFTAGHRGGSGEPLVLLHGFTDTWRTWELVLDPLEAHHDVLAPTLAGHAGGPALPAELDDDALVEAVEAAMDEAGFETAHVAGNSLGGFVALQLAARGRARSVTALAPAGGWADGDESYKETLQHFIGLKALVQQALPMVDAFVATPQGRRNATQFTTVNYEHLPPELLAHQTRGVAACDAVEPLVAHASSHGWAIDVAQIGCPVRVVWGTEDQLLPWPSAAKRWRDGLPQADWVVLDDVGHCPQLDVPLEAAQLILGQARG